MSCSQVKSWVNLLTALTWLLIGCSLLCSHSGASLLVGLTLDYDCKSKVSVPVLHLLHSPEQAGAVADHLLQLLHAVHWEHGQLGVAPRVWRLDKSL